MKNKISINFSFVIIAVVIGMAVLREFDFETFRFKKIALGILYLCTFIMSIVLIFRKKKKSIEE